MQKSLKISYIELMKILNERLGGLPKGATIKVVTDEEEFLIDERARLEITSEIDLPE